MMSQLVSGGIASLRLSDVLWAAFKGFIAGFLLGGLAVGARAAELKEITSALAYVTSAKDLGFKLFTAFGIAGMMGAADANLETLRGPGKAVACVLGRNIQVALVLAEMEAE